MYMPIVSAIQVGKSFGAERIFAGVNFQINEQDRIGLIGQNGAGKSTLLDMLAGREEPDEGTIAVARNTRIGYLTQITDFQPENSLREEMLTAFAKVREWEQELGELALELATPAAQNDTVLHEQLLNRYDELQTSFEHMGGYTYENRIDQVLDGLGFTREQQEAPVKYLSGGQQTRASLAKLLLQEPDLLLLDEPTNHLDLAALEWLETYLLEGERSLVVVSHDRYFLDRVTARTLALDGVKLRAYRGGYSAYARESAREALELERRTARQERAVERDEAFIERERAGQRARQARGRIKRLAKLEPIEEREGRGTIHWRPQAPPLGSETVIETTSL